MARLQPRRGQAPTGLAERHPGAAVEAHQPELLDPREVPRLDAERHAGLEHRRLEVDVPRLGP